jgi:phosphoglycolate phosphatase
MKYKHIIWDWNGTLFDDIDLCVDLIGNVLERRHLPRLTNEQYKNIFDFPVQNYYEAAGLDFSDESFAVVGQEWMDGYELRKREGKLSVGARETLEIIKRHGIGQSILSAYSQHTLVEIVADCGLAGLDNIWAVSKIDLGKKLMADLGYEKGETVLIGDTTHDNEVAREIGADSILIASGHQSEERLKACGVPVYPSLLAFSKTL